MRIYIHYDQERQKWRSWVRGYGRSGKQIYVGAFNARFIASQKAQEKLDQLNRVDPDKWLMHQRWVQADQELGCFHQMT